MPKVEEDVKYIVFDIETIVDGNLVQKVNYPNNDELSDREAREQYAAERLASTGSDFIPLTYHVPVSISVAKINSDFSLLDLASLDEHKSRPHKMTQDFWHGWKQYICPCFVTFNGRGFDLPVMELAAYRYGVNIKRWLAPGSKLYEQPRYRYNDGGHIDLQELLTNFGAGRFHGGLNLAATILGKPGKMEMQGNQVQQCYDEGLLEQIHGYCRCDVLDTYFVFLRTRVMTGELSRENEQRIVAETKEWLELKSDTMAGVSNYLEHWGDWENPW